MNLSCQAMGCDRAGGSLAAAAMDPGTTAAPIPVIWSLMAFTHYPACVGRGHRELRALETDEEV